MYVALAVYYVMFAAPAFGLVALIGLLARKLPRKARTSLLVLSSCLLLTPTWGPATVAVVPVAFGWLLIPTALTWSWADLVELVVEYPRWHAFAFPATGVVAYAVLRWVRPNNSSKPTPLRGAA